MYSFTWPVFLLALNIVTEATSTFWTAGAVHHKHIWPAEFGSCSKLKDNNSSFASFKQSQLEYNISVGRHLHQSSSPVAWPLQDWPKARACCHRPPNASKVLTASIGLFQCLIILLVKKYFLISSPNFHRCSFNHSQPVHLREKGPAPLSQLPLSTKLKEHWGHSSEFLLSKLDGQSPQLLFIRHSFQACHQLCCPPLATSEDLLEFWGSELHTELRVKPQECLIQQESKVSTVSKNL